MKWKVSPFNDFIFKKLFGTVGNEELLRAFLNAVMKDKKSSTDTRDNYYRKTRIRKKSL